MLTNSMKCLRRCLRSKSYVVDPGKTSESADGYEFVEVKPGRVLRVRHIIPDWPVVEEPTEQGGSVSSTEEQHCANSSPPVSLPEDKSESLTAGKDGTHPDEVLFFIHGVGGSVGVWRSQLDFFSRQGYEVIAVDLAGHGASSAPRIAAAYTFYALADDMRLIFKRYARKKNILIGHSYGVSFCTFLAHEFLEQIHKMVLINGGGPTGLEPSSCFDLPTCVLHCLSPVLKWKFLKDGFAHQRAWQKRLLKDAFNVSPFVFRSVMNGQYWPEGNNIYHLKIKVPTLVVHGKHDKFVDIEEDQHMAKILPMGSLQVVEDGSHMVMMECPMDVNSLLHEFFR